MFYLKSQIKPLLTCSLCKSQYKDPRILPCGKTFCADCIAILTDRKYIINCVCKEKFHFIPSRGFPQNETILKLQAQKPNDIQNGEKIEELESLLSKIKKESFEILSGIKNREYKIKEYCSSIKNDIDIATESAIQIIQNYRDDLLKEVDEYEQKSIDSSNINLCLEADLKSFVDEMKASYEKWKAYLRSTKNDIQQIDAGLADCRARLEQINEKKTTLNSYLFNNKQIRFNPNHNYIDKGILGSLNIKYLDGYIDFKSLKKLNIQQYLDYAPLSDFDFIDSDNILVCFTSDCINIDFYKFNKNKNISEGTLTRLEKYTWSSMKFIRCFVVNQRIFCLVNGKARPQVGFGNGEPSIILELDPTSFKIINEKQLDSKFLSFDLNSKLICGRTALQSVQFYKHNFDFEYELKRNYFSLGFSDVIINVKISEKYCFIMSERSRSLEKVTLMDIVTKSFVTEFEIKFDSFSIYNDSILFAFDNRSKSLVYYDYNGVRKNQEKITDNARIHYAKEGQNGHIFYDRASGCIYFQ